MPQPTTFYGGIDPLLPSEIKPALYYYDEYQSYDLLWIDKIDKRIANVFSWANNSILLEILINQKVLIERFFPYENLPHAKDYGIILFTKLKEFASSDWCCPEPLWGKSNSQVFNLDIPESAILSGSNLGFSDAGFFVNPKIAVLTPVQLNKITMLYMGELFVIIPDKETLDSDFIWLSYLVFDVKNEIAEYIFSTVQIPVKKEKSIYNFPPYTQSWSVVASKNNEDISAIIANFPDNSSQIIQNLFYLNIEDRLDQIINLLNNYFEDSIGKILKSFNCSIDISIPEWEGSSYSRFYTNPVLDNNPIIPNVSASLSDFEYMDYPAKKYAYIFANNPYFVAEDIIEGEIYFNKNNSQIVIDFYPFENAYKFTFLDSHHPEIFPFGYYEWSFSGAGKHYPSWLFDANNPEFSFLMNDIPSEENPVNPSKYYQYSFSADGAYRQPFSAFRSNLINSIKPNALGLILDIPLFSGVINWWDNKYYPGELRLPYHFGEFRSDPLAIHRAFRNIKYCSIFELFTDINPCGLLICPDENATGVTEISLIDTNTKSILATGTNSVSWSGRINRILKSKDSTNKEYEISFIEQTTSSGNLVFYPTPEFIINAIDAKYYNPQFLGTGEHNYNMPDSLRIKQIHASLDASKFSKDDNDPNKPRVANLGYLLERVARVNGISVNSDGSVRSIRNSIRLDQDKVIPAGYNFGQFGEHFAGNTNPNQGQLGGEAGQVRDGIVYELKSNILEKDNLGKEIIKPGGYVLCENIPQYLHIMLQDLDKALGLQELGAFPLPTSDNKDYIVYEGLHSLIAEIAFMLSRLSDNIVQTHVLGLKNNALLMENLRATGLAIKEKRIDIQIDNNNAQMLTPGLADDSLTITELLFQILQNLSLLVGTHVTPAIQENNDK